MPTTATRRPTRAPRRSTERQAAFICDLLDRKNLFASPRFFDAVNAMDAEELAAYIAHLKEKARQVSKDEASRWIGSLLDLPDKEEQQRERGSARIETTLPAGHYAVTGEDGTTDFYRVDRPTEGRWAGCTFVKLQLSDSYRRIPRANALVVLEKIDRDGAQAAMERYGRELGRCGHCRRLLTNPESRKRGIGPVCARGMGW